MHSLLQDIRYAARTLRRSPGFTAVAVLALGLGIGANTAVFTVVNGVLLRPLPFPDPDRLVALSMLTPDSPFVMGPGLPDREYVAFRAQNQFLEKVAAFAGAPVNLSGAGEAASVSAGLVTPDFFAVLRARPALGRTFLPGEDQPGKNHVVVLSRKLWQEHFGGGEALANKRLKLDGEAYTVIGVMPAGFAFPANADLWIPKEVAIEEHQSMVWAVIGRLKPGAAASQVVAELETIGSRVPAEAFGREGNQRPVAQAMPLLEFVSGKAERALVIFQGAVAFVLLIACANVANLMLSRAAGRRQELAVRSALGAGRKRLVAQLLVESTMVALAGGFAGLLLALWGVPALAALAPAGTLPRIEHISLDGWVLAFTLVLSLAAGIGFGILPALQATRVELREPLNLSGRTTTGRHETLRGALVVSEIALAVVLLTGAGLMLKSFVRLVSGHTGFRPENAVAMSLNLANNVYQTRQQIESFRGRTLERIARLPGVTAAGIVNWLPFGEPLIMGDFHLEDGRPLPRGYMPDKPAVSAGYFRAMGIRTLAGRDFTEGDKVGAPGVVVLSESVARRFWPAGDAIGKRITMEDHPKPGDWLTIVGVVEDVKQTGMADHLRDTIYQPLAQVTQPFFLSNISFVARTAGNPAPLAGAMRAIVRSIDKDQPVEQVVTMQDLLARSTAEPRFQARLLGAFSILALMLAVVGVYGVLAYSVAERTQEIGIRMALGAEARDVFGMVMRRTLVLAGAGVGLGIAGALAVTRVLAKFLFEVKPNDPATFAAVTLALAAVALAAGWIPARRATQVDPMTALRYQ